MKIAFASKVATFHWALQVAAGLGHCLALTPEGVLYSWGWNAAGCLGLGEPGRHQHDVSTPTQVHPSKILLHHDLCAFMNYCCELSSLSAMLLIKISIFTMVVAFM